MPKSWSRLAVVSVHALTAAGAGVALLALIAIADGRIERALIWMALALAIDGFDGPLARRLRVAERCPAVDGVLLDNLVDYVTYVVVPAFLIHRAVPLPDGLTLAAPLGICVASAFQFAQSDAKSKDGAFRGFPSYWNLAAFYLLILGWPAPANGAALLTLCALVFVPIHYVHPVRTAELRGITLSLTGLWAIGLLRLLWQYPEPDRRIAYLSLLYVVYYVAVSLRMTRTRRRGGERLRTRRLP